MVFVDDVRLPLSRNILNDLLETQKLVYEPNGLQCANVVIHPESQEYGACSFELNSLRVEFRVANITLTKIGQFVTFWKRSVAGPITPYDVADLFDFLVVAVRAGNRFGQFVFSKGVLLKHGVLSEKNRGGKRALRVYPLWDIPESAQACKTQVWQLQYFCEVSLSISSEQIKKLYRV